MSQPLEWTPPGPGSWELAADHYARPVTTAMLPFLDVWSEASTAWMLDVGLPIRSASMRPVNGLPYVNIDDGSGGRTPPPPWVMRVAVKLMPSMRRAERRLSEVFSQRPWVAGLAAWYEEGRAAATTRMLRLARTDLAALDDRELATHIEGVAAEVMASGREHIRMHAHDSVPAGLFVVTAMDFGLERGEALALLAGSSPASTGQSDELLTLRRAVDGRPARSLDELRDLGPEVADALDDYLAHHGARVVDGYDIDALTIGELPDMVLALATAPISEPKDQGAATDAARSLIPAECRSTFDRQLADARAAYGARDDNGGILVAWPTGLLRLAMLEAGRRMVDGGLLDRSELALEATVDELVSALGGGAIDRSELHARRHHRRTLTSADAPRVLGPPAAPPPEGLSGSLGLAMRVSALFTMAVDVDTSDELRGMGIGDASYTGRARVVDGGQGALDRFEPGDVLVAPMTSPSYNVLLSLAGAVVTDEGGPLSHAAIMVRELGLPAVIGAAGATSVVVDGDTVAVDPVAGLVTVEAPGGAPAHP
ncbi:MAG: hypothetical protein JJU45_17340 [Acidimicrobiia bacterium]|nr:hypothetical protein [Acidimicrobiia bacterium]